MLVPDDSAASELAEWYLTYVSDPVSDSSDLVIIDASNFNGNPVARVRLPQPVPHGFHGNWIADQPDPTCLHQLAACPRRSRPREAGHTVLAQRQC